MPAPHLAQPGGCAALRIVLGTVPCVGRSYEHFPDGFDLHLPHQPCTICREPRLVQRSPRVIDRECGTDHPETRVFHSSTRVVHRELEFVQVKP